MKLKTLKHAFFPFLFVLTISTAAIAQNAAPLSPLDSASGSLNSGANIKIVYSSPSVRGRKIWGELVPYDKVWRAGANAATLIQTDKDIRIEGKLLPAGTYSLYAVPMQEANWSIIFSSQVGQAGMNHDGTTTLDMGKVVLRVLGYPKKSKSLNERLIYAINPKGFVLSWENIEVAVSAK